MANWAKQSVCTSNNKEPFWLNSSITDPSKVRALVTPKVKCTQTILGSTTGCGLCGVRKGIWNFFKRCPCLQWWYYFWKWLEENWRGSRNCCLPCYCCLGEYHLFGNQERIEGIFSGRFWYSHSLTTSNSEEIRTSFGHENWNNYDQIKRLIPIPKGWL